MATNDFKSFSGGGSANVLTQGQYLALAASLIANGFQTGLAPSNQFNKVWRQASMASSVLGDLIGGITGQNAVDDGTTATILSNLLASIMRAGYVADTGTVNSYVATLVPAVLAYYDGMVVGFSTANANTTTNPTLNVNGLGAVTITGVAGSALSAGQIPTNSPVWATYNSTGPRFELKNSSSGSASQPFSASTVNGATISTPNAALNPNFDIAQRGTSFVSAANAAYDLDGWSNANITSGIIDIIQGTGHTTGRSSRQVTVTTSDTSIAAGDVHADVLKITGYDIVNYDLVGNTFTVAFWAKFPVTGSHGVSLRNSGGDRSYVHEINVTSANTWTEYQFTVVGGLPTGGTWNYTTGVGLQFRICHACGSTYQTASVDQWVSGNYQGTINQVNDLATVGNVWAISNVRINKGTQPTSATVSRAEMLVRCQERVRNIGNSSLYGQIGNGQCISATAALVEVDVRGMQTIPVIENTLTANLFELEVGVNRVTVTAISINGSATADTNKLNLSIGVASGLVAGQVCGLRNNNTATNKIILSSDI